MANSITLAKKYVPLLDEVYKNASLTAILDGNPDLVREGINANEMCIPKISMDGLGDYSRSSGYVDGDVTLTWETVKCLFDRGRMFNVDAEDNEESAGIAFGRLAGEFIRTKVVPEVDAYRFATYAGTDGISKVVSGATLSTGADVMNAIGEGIGTEDEAEVPTESRYLFITPTLLRLIQNMDTTKSRELLSTFAGVVPVPQARFYTKITQYNGSSDGEKAGGYVKHSDGKDINFMIIEKSAVIQFPKHVVPKIITPEMNQSSDGWKFGYRYYGIADIYENKVAGIYLHHKGAYGSV